MDPIQTHSSGVGVFLLPPAGLHYRFWRTPGPQLVSPQLDARGAALLDEDGQPLPPVVTDLPVLYGYSDQAGARYLDFDVPDETDVTYRLEVADADSDVAEDASWRSAWQGVVRLSPRLGYSALNDGEMNDVLSVRDALVVFLATRLAQEVRAGRLYTRNRAYRRRYNVRTEYEFEEAELPVISVGYGYGAGHGMDLGWTATEEIVKISLQASTFDKRERDELTNALRGIIAQINQFLEDLGCLESSFGELVENEVHSSPFMYTLEMSISTTLYTQVGYYPDAPWRLRPIDGWAGEDYGAGHLF